MQTLLEKVKVNLILDHNQDDEFLQNLIFTATSYAESYQKKEDGFYSKHDMHPTTEQAVIMLSSHFYESRDGSTGGFFSDNVQASNQVWTVVNRLLNMNKDFKM